MNFPQQQPPRLIRHRVHQVDGFLDDAELGRLMETVFASETRFASSGVSDSKDDYRRSLVLLPPADIERMMTEKIRGEATKVMEVLRMAPFPVGRIECQITAHHDGSFFRVHTDAGVNNTVKRVFTYVYYFNRQPKGYSGGELRVYDDQVRNGKLAMTDSFQVIEPRHNSIVFFQAAIMHEVTLVRVPSGQFRDYRFTVNGWIHRQ
jgi:Rps23 Pro-64 3,4-dihydroxylase Tpa1-like proline 4-hydroxylase